MGEWWGEAWTPAGDPGLFPGGCWEPWEGQGQLWGGEERQTGGEALDARCWRGGWGEGPGGEDEAWWGAVGQRGPGGWGWELPGWRGEGDGKDRPHGSHLVTRGTVGLFPRWGEGEQFWGEDTELRGGRCDPEGPGEVP